ncbi:MAG: hypothetical protein LBK59_05985, partial [Bifidobacteriaceae bacterium]|nr:hypothetical protein [Bifidobacteriaceae bacterium]
MRRLLTSHPSARVTLSVFLGGALVVPAGVPATATPSPGVGAAARGTSSSMVTVATDPMRLKEVASKPARVQVSWKKTKKTKKYLVEAFSDARLKNLVTSKRTKKN